MHEEIKDKVVLITGASTGIGAATARLFDRAGARVAMAARRKELLDELAREMHDPLSLKVDLSKEEEARQMVREVVGRFGQIDVLINNAASMIVVPSDEVNRDDLLHAFRVNLLGPVTATQEAISHMKRQGGGHIINVGSPGFMLGIPYYSPYVCAKAAFSAWTRTIQAEWQDRGITVSEYFPGYVQTDSKPDSRIGEVDQDFLMSRNQNRLARAFTRPTSPGSVAKQLLKLAIHPRPLAYSGFSVRIGVWIASLPGLRLSIAAEMARTARAKLKKE